MREHTLSTSHCAACRRARRTWMREQTAGRGTGRGGGQAGSMHATGAHGVRERELQLSARARRHLIVQPGIAQHVVEDVRGEQARLAFGRGLGDEACDRKNPACRHALANAAREVVVRPICLPLACPGAESAAISTRTQANRIIASGLKQIGAWMEKEVVNVNRYCGQVIGIGRGPGARTDFKSGPPPANWRIPRCMSSVFCALTGYNGRREARLDQRLTYSQPGVHSTGVVPWEG